MGNPSRDPAEVMAFVEAQRKARNIRKSDLADRANMSPSSYSHFVSGKRIPDYQTCQQLLMALGYDCMILITEKQTGRLAKC